MVSSDGLSDMPITSGSGASPRSESISRARVAALMVNSGRGRHWTSAASEHCATRPFARRSIGIDRDAPQDVLGLGRLSLGEQEGSEKKADVAPS